MTPDFALPAHAPAKPSSVTAIPVRADNYVWCIGPLPGAREVVIVDPGEAEPVIAHLQQQGLALATILITHHHYDHVDGIPALKALWPAASVFGPASAAAKGVESVVQQGMMIPLPAVGLTAQVIETPGHTRDDVSYFCPEFSGHPQPALFCGDTLFAAGCGRVFEGTMAQMFESLTTLATTLPASTQVYAAHEYTLSNLLFALAAEPDNPQLHERLSACRQLRNQGKPTLPSSLELEIATNPFLRSHLPALSRHLPADLHADDADAFAVFEALRRWKNDFRPPA